MSTSDPTPRTLHPASGRALRRARFIGLAVLTLLGGGAGVRAYVNAAHARSVEAATRHNAVRTVLVTKPQPAKGQRMVALPATLRGQNESALFARTNGYVRSWKKDMGDQVRQGDVLAIIDTPEVDQELAQAAATVEQIKARVGLTQSSLARWEGLRLSNAVSAQELDERRAAQQQARADLAAAQANVRRLQQLHDFGRITAPFDGVVIRRNVEVGALVAAGSAANTKELFYLAQTSDLRLTVAVPQVYAGDVHVGKEVTIKLIEKPNAPVKGEITRVSGGIDVATRSVQVEVSLPTREGKLLPGSYVEVGLPLSGASRALLVPPNTLQFRQEGPRVAVVSEGNKVYLRPVKLGRDLGRSVEVLEGLSAQDTVVLNPHDTIEEGERVVSKPVPEDAERKDGAKDEPSAKAKVKSADARQAGKA